jgi:CRP/FNR family transcriptional regulator
MNQMKMITRDQFLEVFTMFRNSPDSMIRKLLASALYKEFAQNTSLFSSGDSCPGIGFFLSGEVRVFKIGESGREITLYDVLPGETCILNASCILSHGHYPANAMALKDGEVLFTPDKTFLELIAEYEDMRKFIFSLFSLRLTNIMELVDEVTFRKMDSRLIDYLVEKSENGILQSTHQSIANDLGTSREVISRLLKDLERQKKIILSRTMIQLINL